MLLHSRYVKNWVVNIPDGRDPLYFHSVRRNSWRTQVSFGQMRPITNSKVFEQHCTANNIHLSQPSDQDYSFHNFDIVPAVRVPVFEIKYSSIATSFPASFP